MYTETTCGSSSRQCRHANAEKCSHSKCQDDCLSRPWSARTALTAGQRNSHVCVDDCFSKVLLVRLVIDHNRRSRQTGIRLYEYGSRIALYEHICISLLEAHFRDVKAIPQ